MSCKCIPVFPVLLPSIKVKIANVSCSLPCAWHCFGCFTLLPCYPHGYKSHSNKNSSYFRRSLWRLSEGTTRCLVSAVNLVDCRLPHNLLGSGCRMRTCPRATATADPALWDWPLATGLGCSGHILFRAALGSRLLARPMYSSGPTQGHSGWLEQKSQGKLGSCSLGARAFTSAAGCMTVISSCL